MQRIGKVLLRAGFVFALILGLGMLFGWFGIGGIIHFHMLAGILALAGGWLVLPGAAAGRQARLGGALLLTIGAIVGMLMMSGTYFAGSRELHMTVMLLGTAACEMGGARGNRAGARG